MNAELAIMHATHKQHEKKQTLTYADVGGNTFASTAKMDIAPAIHDEDQMPRKGKFGKTPRQQRLKVVSISAPEPALPMNNKSPQQPVIQPEPLVPELPTIQDKLAVEELYDPFSNLASPTEFPRSYSDLMDEYR